MTNSTNEERDITIKSFYLDIEEELDKVQELELCEFTT